MLLQIIIGVVVEKNGDHIYKCVGFQFILRNIVKLFWHNSEIQVVYLQLFLLIIEYSIQFIFNGTIPYEIIRAGNLRTREGEVRGGRESERERTRDRERARE